MAALKSHGWLMTGTGTLSIRATWQVGQPANKPLPSQCYQMWNLAGQVLQPDHVCNITCKHPSHCPCGPAGVQNALVVSRTTVGQRGTAGAWPSSRGIRGLLTQRCA